MWALVFISVFLLISLENLALCSICYTDWYTYVNTYSSYSDIKYCPDGCCGFGYYYQYCCSSITYPRATTTQSEYTYNGGSSGSGSQNKGYIAAIVVPLIIGLVVIVAVYSYLFYCKKAPDSNAVNVATLTTVLEESGQNQPAVWQTGVNMNATGSVPVPSIQTKVPFTKPVNSQTPPASVMPYQQPPPYGYQTPTYTAYQPHQLPGQVPSYMPPQQPGQVPTYMSPQQPGHAPSYMLPPVQLKNQSTQTN